MGGACWGLGSTCTLGSTGESEQGLRPAWKGLSWSPVSLRAWWAAGGSAMAAGGGSDGGSDAGCARCGCCGPAGQLARFLPCLQSQAAVPAYSLGERRACEGRPRSA